MMLFLFSDILRGIEKIQEELHPSIYSHQFDFHIQPVQFNPKNLYILKYQPVLRLFGDDYNFAQLRLPRNG